MDRTNSKPGAAEVQPALPVTKDDIKSLPSDLQSELKRLEDQFTVDGKKLKDISQRFEEELQDGRGTVIPQALVEIWLSARRPCELWF